MVAGVVLVAAGGGAGGGGLVLVRGGGGGFWLRWGGSDSWRVGEFCYQIDGSLHSLVALESMF